MNEPVECFEDFSELPAKSNHPWTTQDYDNPETAVCRNCGRKMIEWIADMQNHLFIHKSRQI